MIKAFLEVVKDLWCFVFGISLRNSVVVSENIPATVAEPDNANKENAFSGVMVPNIKAGESYGRTAYVIEDMVFCMSKPKMSFDTQIGTLFYGDKVTVDRMKDSSAEVDNGLFRGWVESKDLSDDINDVLPKFRSSYVYDANNEQTLKLRRFLRDEFFGGKLELPLQTAEYIFYVLKRSGVEISWPSDRPRIPGTWQNILRGKRGVNMGIQPRTNSILEYSGNGTPGFLGYVEAVHPDESITLQTVGRVVEGEFRVEEFTRDEWKEWRPTFISFV